MNLNSTSGNPEEWDEPAPTQDLDCWKDDCRREAAERKDPFHPIRRNKGEKRRNRRQRGA